MPPEQRQILEATPTWVNVAYGVAVFGGVLGAIGLLMKKRWAVTFFLLSLVGLVAQMLGTFLVTPAWTAARTRWPGDADPAAGDRAVPAVVRTQGRGARLDQLTGLKPTVTAHRPPRRAVRTAVMEQLHDGQWMLARVISCDHVLAPQPPSKQVFAPTRASRVSPH